MDLHRDVVLKNSPRAFGEYVATIAHEQESSMEWLGNPASTWTVPPGLQVKVTEQGHFRPFYGDTVVLPLSAAEIDMVSRRMEILQSRVPDLLAEPLDTTELHLTLHDLSNGPDRAALDKAMARNQAHCRDIFRHLGAHFDRHPQDARVELVSTRAYPSVATSAVLGFVPRSDRDFRMLMNMYNLFDDVVYLDYWLRPHVTLAYFTPMPLDAESRQRLRTALREADDMGPVTLSFDARALAYQHFVDMNRYHTLMTVGQPEI